MEMPHIESTVELQLSGLIGTASNPDMLKIRKMDVSFETGYIGSSKFGSYCLQYVPASGTYCLAVLLLYDQLLVWLCCYCMISCLSGCAVIV
jgi:hypothetical protein